MVVLGVGRLRSSRIRSKRSRMASKSKKKPPRHREMDTSRVDARIASSTRDAATPPVEPSLFEPFKIAGVPLFSSDGAEVLEDVPLMDVDRHERFYFPPVHFRFEII